MNTLYGGSICLTDLIAQAKKGHSSFSKAQNGKVYANILTWVNDTPDKFGNTMSHQLSSIKEMRDKEEKVYIGNSKKLETNQPVSSNDVQEDSFDNIPVRQSKAIEEPDGLPF
jgi:hypothetical protein